MSKIIKFNNLNLDKENIFNVDTSSAFIPGINAEVIKTESQNYEAYDEYENEEYEYDEEDKFDQLEMTEEDVLKIAKNQAEKILVDAETEAEMIISQAREEALAQRDEIFRQAEEQGYEEGYNKAVSDAENIKLEAETMLQNTINESEEILASIEPSVVELIIGIVRKILSDAITINPDVISCLIKKTLQNVNTSGDIFVHVSENEYEAVAKAKDSILDFNEKGTNIEIVRDTMLNKGDCVIETPFGNIDCGVDQQFNAVKENLFFILDNRNDKK